MDTFSEHDTFIERPNKPKIDMSTVKQNKKRNRNNKNRNNDEQQYISLSSKIIQLIIKITRSCTKKGRPI